MRLKKKIKSQAIKNKINFKYRIIHLENLKMKKVILMNLILQMIMNNLMTKSGGSKMPIGLKFFELFFWKIQKMMMKMIMVTRFITN